jgi:protein-disulfide isomerase
MRFDTVNVKATERTRESARARVLAAGLAGMLAAVSLGATPAGATRRYLPSPKTAGVRETAGRSPIGGQRSGTATLPPSAVLVSGSRPAAIDAVRRLLNGIPQMGNALGYASAPVTLQVFGDLECPICRELALGALSRLIPRDVRARKLRIEYRSLQTATREPSTFIEQQVAALAAGRQNKMWYFVELFYREQGREDSGYVTEAYLHGIARQVPGLSLSAWDVARRDPLLTEEISQDELTASRRRFDGTPAFLIGRTGRRLRPLHPSSLEEPEPYEAAIDRLLSASP